MLAVLRTDDMPRPSCRSHMERALAIRTKCSNPPSCKSIRFVSASDSPNTISESYHKTINACAKPAARFVIHSHHVAFHYLHRSAWLCLTHTFTPSGAINSWDICC